MINDIYQATNSSAFSWMVIIAWPAPELEMFGETTVLLKKSAWFISWDLQYQENGWVDRTTYTIMQEVGRSGFILQGQGGSVQVELALSSNTHPSDSFAGVI